jgi:RimJ/RimL family protein N-acetyltransferase
MNPTISLRDVEASDLAFFFAHQSDPEGAALAAFKSRDKPAFAEHWAKLLRDDISLKQAILSDGYVVGNIGSWNSGGQREVGYWIDRAYWGGGVGSAALSAFLRLENTRPLHAGVAKHNAASLRVLQKCGFTTLPDTDETHYLLVLAGDVSTR